MILAFLGPRGSFSEIAAKKFRPEAELMAYPTFIELFKALESGECDYIAVPIENSLNGSVSQNIDLMQASDAVAVEECVVEVDHRLATLEGADINNITRIYSHQQALAQCAGYLSKNFPKAELIASPSTSAGLKLVKDRTEAAIVGAHLKAEGFTLSGKNIADGERNMTHFLLVKKGEAVEGAHSQKVFFSATCKHKPGALISLLQPIGERGVNMTKIQSRPIKDRPGEYRFFIEIEGDIADGNCAQTIESIKRASNSFKILGCY